MKARELPQYKLDQMMARQQLRLGRIIWNGGTANFGIKQFKRDHKSDNQLIRTFKTNVWASMIRGKNEV